jgi:hypothetical protein
MRASTTSVTSPRRPCEALTKRGEPCQAPALLDSSYCPHHDPARELARRAERARGGRARHGRTIGTVGGLAVPVELATLADVVELLRQEITAVRQLESSFNRGRTIGYLASVAARALEASELESRLAELERMYAERS